MASPSTRQRVLPQSTKSPPYVVVRRSPTPTFTLQAARLALEDDTTAVDNYPCFPRFVDKPVEKV